MRVLSTVRFTLLRLMRNYIVLLLLFVVPIALLTVFSVILSGMVDEEGRPYFDQTALTMVLAFQLFGGSTAMSYLNEDLFALNRERMAVAPFNRTFYAFSILLAGSAFSFLLGAAIMVYTRFALGLVWENWGWTLYLIALMAVLSSIVCIILVCGVKSFRTAERLSEVYGVGFVLLAGLFFPMPRHAVFDFLGSYGNPLTLSVGSVRAAGIGNWNEAWFRANMVLAAIGVLFLLMLAMGKRRLR